MNSEEIYGKVNFCVENEDYEGACDLSDRLNEEPWRSSAFKLLVDLFLSPRGVEKFGNDAFAHAYLLADNEIKDASIRAKIMMEISNLAAMHQNWEIYQKAISHVAVCVFFAETI
jgi:hypothetical protein